MRIVVVALGKIGLPLAAFAARQGHEVVGCDIDPRVVELVAAAREPFPGEAGLADALRETVVGVARDGTGSLRATTDTVAAVAEGADLILAVPPLVVDVDARPDWRALDAALTAVGEGLARGKAQRGTVAGPDGAPPSIVVETTLPVGSTRSRVAPLLERVSGLSEGVDFHAAHSPERVYSGRIFRDLETYPKIVGGLDELGEARTAARYRRLLNGTGARAASAASAAAAARTAGTGAEAGDAVEVRALGGAEAAELTKLAETTYRDLNIAFANELARHADAIGVDVDGVIDAANSQPFSHIHRPGVAVGGHCIPVYPRFYLAGDPDATLPAAARAVNEAMPAYAVDLLGAALGEAGGAGAAARGAGAAPGAEAAHATGAADTAAPAGVGTSAARGDEGVATALAGRRVLILGAAYRGDVQETAFSGVFALRDALRAAGAVPQVADPLYDDEQLRALDLHPWDGEPVAGAILQADHAAYRELTPADVPGVRAIVDGRSALDVDAWRAAGVIVRRIGRDAVRPTD